jgi:hypothetical protein
MESSSSCELKGLEYFMNSIVLHCMADSLVQGEFSFLLFLNQHVAKHQREFIHAWLGEIKKSGTSSFNLFIEKADSLVPRVR